MARRNIYLDHNATTPVDGEIKAQIAGWLESFGNASSIHWAGRGPKALIRQARQKFAEMVGANSLELIFTSGGSEANNLAIKGIFEMGGLRSRYLVSAVEHPSVMRTYEELKRRGAQVDVIPVDRGGVIDMEAYESLLTEETALVSVMLANNETGSIFPIKKMAKLAHAKGALFHCDAVQALGKIPLNLTAMEADLVSFSGHKFYSLKGAGVLYCRRGVQLNPQILGGGQERHRRGGTENVLAIASLGAMCERASEVMEHSERMRELRDWLEAQIQEQIPGVEFNGRDSKRLPNTSSFIMDGIDGETLLMNLDLLGFAISTGAACSSGSPEPSPVLRAMGLSRKQAQSSLRLSIGWNTTREELELFVYTLVQIVARLRSQLFRETTCYAK